MRGQNAQQKGPDVKLGERLFVLVNDNDITAQNTYSFSSKSEGFGLHFGGAELHLELHDLLTVPEQAPPR